MLVCCFGILSVQTTGCSKLREGAEWKRDEPTQVQNKPNFKKVGSPSVNRFWLFEEVGLELRGWRGWASVCSS